MSNSVFSEGAGVQQIENSTLLVVFNFLQIFGFFALGIIVLTAWLAPTVHRTGAWYSFMGSWMSFYFLIAGQQEGAQPNLSVCIVQAAFVYAAPPLTSTVSVAFLLHLFSTVSTIFTSSNRSRNWRVVMHLFPFAVHFVIFLETLIVGLANSDKVFRDRTGMFCSFNNIPFQLKLTSAVVILDMIAMLVLEALTFVLLRRNWAAFKRLRVRSNGTLSLPLMIRVSLFSFLPMIAMVLGTMSFMPDPPISEAQSNVVVAFLPTAAAVIFGTQQDILRVWMFWKNSTTVVSREAGARLKPNFVNGPRPNDSPV
ncbi:hypothetical protein FB45DRAFT_1017601 [Roridomyces roridus]|uniref:Uncharacterized protein n=1 Tax=Roridomyces roridus TaxID=1738132 RepID=A0AAD7G1Y6_9AGAR|nr:hypothetical protein FB45DRAFT_1017601 [Roridomyces roridus]